MGKSKPKNGEARKEMISLGNLKGQLARLQAQYQDLQLQVERMETEGFDSVSIDGLKTPERGMDLVDQFLSKVEAEVSMQIRKKASMKWEEEAL